MNNANQVDQGYRGGQEVAAERAIALAMSSLACQVGELRTVANELARRISPMIPGGSPFEREAKMAQNGPSTATPKAVRSHHCEELDSRTFELRELTNTLQSIVANIEI